MIPEFTHGEVLPPFTNEDVVGQFRSPRSPYNASFSDLVDRFATSPERAAILRGLKRYRDVLRGEGFQHGFQWIDGSFVENCEVVRRRPPGDVDLVSLLRRPPHVRTDAEWSVFLDARWDEVFDSDYCKGMYHCDAYPIDLDASPEIVCEQTVYWFGLFSHQRDTFRWKGLVQIDLQSDDEAAMERLLEIEATW